MKIFTIGGYGEVGKNMTAVQIGDDVVIFDAGLYLPPIVELEENERFGLMNEKHLRRIQAIPNDTVLDQLGLRNKVRAMLIGHAHLDHVGAIPYLAPRYNADVLGTPFTMNVLKSIMRDEKTSIHNQLKVVQPNSSIAIKSKSNLRAEFINITHSTLQCSMLALHTKEGVVLYANDFKFDNSPQLGKKPNYDALKAVAKEGVKALIVESLYADEERKTPSEKVARSLLEDVMLTTDNENAGILVTTFSSHIARLKSIVNFSNQLGRKAVFAGRSLNKYMQAAIDAKLCPFNKDVILLAYRKQAESFFKRINKNKKDYVIVCTGHQGEPHSMLDRISRRETTLQLDPNDHVIFSSKTIPTEINIANKGQLDKRLKHFGCRIFNEVHVSGHAGREDLRDFINMINPEHIIPAHGDLPKLSALAELATELGYKLGKTCHIMQDLQSLEV
ncbi:MAG: RNase J family beta-CASP ribonuclease [Candidatus Pacearchaeota archaeon]|nr:RNase J family beta-CASP ribonuclease [Candidatus Pacearchaeota archaeon]